MQRITLYVCLIGICLTVIFSAEASAADIVDGRAVIENENIPKAQEEARKDAMRGFVENKLGVHVESSSLVVNNMLVRDTVLAHSDGYVSIRRILKEWRDGDLYFIRMELDADEKKIQTTAADIQTKLQALGNDSSRSGIQVSIIGMDENSQLKDISQINQYFQSKIRQTGFTVIGNDDVMQYLSQAYRTGEFRDKLKLNAEVRKIARNKRTEENAIVRGELSTIQLDRVGTASFKAVVLASFELIGLDSNIVDPFSEYFMAIGATREEAVHRAEDLAAGKAAEKLGQLALETWQSEFRGGVRNIRTTLSFSGISDRATQRQSIINGLAAVGCRVLRSSFSSNGNFNAFVETSAFSSSNDLGDAILQNIPGLQQGNDQEEALGSSKLYFSF